MTRLLRFAALVLAPLFAAYGQFSLYQVNGTAELPVATAFDFGAVDVGAKASAPFRIRNTSAATATLSALSVSGVGFSLAGPAVPATLASQASLDFTVNFQGATAGLYSAGLNATGISVLLVAEVQQGLTYSVSTASGWRALSTTDTVPVNFGSIAASSSAALHFLVQNPSALYLTVPAISVGGQGFGLAATPPSGILLSPQQTATFDVVFTPPAGGTFSGSLRAGNSVFTLAGAGIAPPLPTPTLTLDLPQTSSGQQGSAAIAFAAPSPADAAGTLTLSFQPLAAGATDPAIEFASGTLSLPFTLAAGAVEGDFGGAPALFQTGTTAGTLTFTATIGSASAQQSIVIPPAPVAVTSAQATRGSGTIRVQVTAYDNTRTAGKIAYTFLDAQGNAIAPGAIAVDSSADFAAYFAGSTNGGLFSLTAAFPVTGDISQIKSFQVQFTNSAGSSTTQPTSF